MTTYKEIFGKPIKVLTGDPAPTPITYTVTVSNPGSGNVYYIDGVQTPTLELYEGNTYNFDYSAATGHPFRFATAADAAGSTEYTTGVSVDSNITTIVVASGAPTLFYYCTNHSGMGGRALTPASPSEYEGQIWYNETTGKFRSVVASSAWSSASPLITGRHGLAGGGTQTACAFWGGDGPSNKTEEYNGSGFSSGGNLPYSAIFLAGCGTQTAGLACGGDPGPTQVATACTYDGSSWTGIPSLNTARSRIGATGITSAALAFGGGNPNGVDNSEEYSGSSWSEGNNLNTARRVNNSGGGPQTAAIVAGGAPGPSPSTSTNATEEYNGSSWTTTTNLGTATREMGSSGTQTAFLVSGGLAPSASTTCQQYDGTSWTTLSAALPSAVNQHDQEGTTSAAISTGGNPSLSATNEFNVSANVITAAAWSSGGALNQARRIQGNVGGKDAGLSFGGYTSSPEYLNVSEEYDGTSWTEGNNLNTARYGLRGFGIQTAAVAIGGQAQPAPTAIASYESYDGSSWTASGNMNVAREEPGGFGILTAGVATGGFNSDPSTMLTSTEEYDGSSWTSGGATSIASQSMGASGTLTAGSIAGGYLGPPGARTNRTEEYGGTSWTSGPNVFINVSNQAPAKNGTQDAWQFAGGRAPGIISTTCVYDGSSWATGPNIATARTEFDGGGASSGAGAHLICGGQPGSSSAGVTTTEEFSGETTALNYKNISTS